MPSFTQLKLQLTKDEDVLSQLRRNKAMRDAGDTAKEHLCLQFDGREFKFFHNQPVVVPLEVGNHLYRSSGVLMGDPLSGRMQGGIEKVEQWELGEVEPSKRASKTSCPQCGEEQYTKAQLIKHLEKCGESEPQSPQEPAHKVVQVGQKKAAQ